MVGRGWTQAGGRPHAEAVALDQAGEAAKGATLYVTLEPCAHLSPRGPSCSSLLATSGILRAVVGCGDPDPRTAFPAISAQADDAILVGGGTWRADTPRLDVRLPGLQDRSPERVVLTRGSIEGVRTIAAPEDIATLDALYLYVEGGAATAAAFLASDFVDRLEIYRAPILVGNGLPALRDIGLTDLAGAHGRWQRAETRILGPDVYERYERFGQKG